MQRSSIGCSIALHDATKFSRVQRSLEGCDRWGEGEECYISKTRRFSGKIFDPGGPGSGLDEDLVSGNNKIYIFWPMNMKQQSCDGRGARSAQVT